MFLQKNGNEFSGISKYALRTIDVFHTGFQPPRRLFRQGTKKPPVDNHRRLRILSIKYPIRLGDLDIYCIHSFFATLRVEGDLVPFADVVNQTGDVYKNLLLGGIVNNETKSLGFVEEFYCSSVHCKKLKMLIWQFAATKVSA